MFLISAGVCPVLYSAGEGLGLGCRAAEKELLWLQNYVFCANSELLLKYRGEGFFYPIILIDISVADFFDSD